MSQENVDGQREPSYTHLMKQLRGGLLTAIGGVLLVLGLFPAISSATYPGANGLIAYSELREPLGRCSDFSQVDNWEIYTISPTGGEPTRLTDNATADQEPSWSADGRRLAFARASVNPCRRNVWTMRADGTHQRQVTHGPAYEGSPSFSPSGRGIVMVRDGDIFKVRTDGTKSVRLTRGQGARNPVFSPDGRRIVFNGEAWNKSKNGIWSMLRDGTHKRLLAREYSGGGIYYHPDFDPDGSHIVFERCSGSSAWVRHRQRPDALKRTPPASHRRRREARLLAQWNPICRGGAFLRLLHGRLCKQGH